MRPEPDVRRRNWMAIAAATVLMLLSYMTYAAAFTTTTEGPDGVELSNRVDPVLVGIGLTIAPFVFIVIAFLSQNPRAPQHVLRAMVLLVAVGLSVGLLDPLAGAATGFAAGGAVALKRLDLERPMVWRYAAVVFTGFYCLALLVFLTPAGVFAGAVLPLVMIGFADEYAVWSETTQASDPR